MPYIEEHLFGEPDRLGDFELARLRGQLDAVERDDLLVEPADDGE